MKKRIVAVMLATVMAGAMICGCSTNTTKEVKAPETAQEPAADEEPDVETKEEPESEEPAAAEAVSEEEVSEEGLSVLVEKEFVSRTDDDGKVLAYGHYPVFKVSGKDYEKLSEALDGLTEKLKKEIESNLDEIAGFASDDLKSGRDLPGGYYTYNCDGLVTRADENVFSIILTYDTFSGGAHPTSWYASDVFDSKSGDELNIGNAVNDTDSLPKVLSDKLLAEYDKETFFDEDVEGMIKESYKEDGNYVFTLDNSGICFYFSAYQLAPYAAGSQIVTFPYAENPELVKAEYVPGDADMIEGIVPQKKYYVGGKDAVSFTWYANYEDDYEYEFNVTANNLDCTEKITCAGMQPYLVKSGDRYYVYVNELQMNDYQSLDIYEVNGSGIKSIGSYERGFRTVSPTDPSDFDLAGRTDLLSTNNTYKSYRVGNDGMPVENEEFDHVIGTVSEKLTLKKDHEFEVYADEKATEAEKTELKEGTVLYYFRTDDKTFMDMKTDDGKVVRIYPTVGEWPQTVDGIDIEELFDGVMFAG